MASGTWARTGAVKEPQSVSKQAPPVCPVQVMQPIVELGAFHGNTAGHAPDVVRTVADRILAIARASCPGAELVETAGGTALLVPTIVQWREMRTGDPIGAFILPHNSIVISLRLMYAGPDSGRTTTFKSRARLTLNQAAGRLLNDAFDRTVRGLLSSVAP